MEYRNDIVSEVIEAAFDLRTPVAKHRPNEGIAAIRRRIARTTEPIEKTARQLERTDRRYLWGIFGGGRLQL